MEALHEIQVAAFLGYRRMADFRRALKRGDIPQPDQILGRDPVWSRSRLEAWLRGDQGALSLEEAEAEAMRRAERGPDTR